VLLKGDVCGDHSWAGCCRYVLPTLARELPAGVVGMLLSGGSGLSGIRIVSNHPKARYFLFPGLMGVQ